MVGEKIAKQMLDMQKATVDQSYSTMMMMQENSEKLMQAAMDQAPWVPEEGKKAVDGWIKALKKNEDDCKKMIDDYFTSMEKFFATEKSADKPIKAKVAKPAATKA